MTTATNHMRVGLTLTQELRPDPSHSNVLAPGESVDLHMVSKVDLFGAERLVIPSDISWKLQVDAILVDGRPQPLGNTYCPGTAQACRREDVFQPVGAYIYNEFAIGCTGDYDAGKTFVVRVTNRSDQAVTLRVVVLGREARAVDKGPEAAPKNDGEPIIVQTNPMAPKSKGEPVIVQMTNPSDRPAIMQRTFMTYDVESKDAPTEPGFTRPVGIFTAPLHMPVDEVILEAAARAAHEANRAWCIAHGDTSQLSWDEAPDWQRSSCIKGVEGVMAGNGPRELHAGWLSEKVATGWVYGPVKDPDTKMHPCMVPYDDLPHEQRAKDGIFVAVVRAVLGAK